ncbi:serine/threonine-protein kinase [Egicoccus halophilus]|uniref:serine/threonine-protein kinase n=1 Tax=Egicoccus halophilus TaxID=1670830 RepID=UPI0013EE6AF3|nr:serine/threonine-protein kinase [Egicoccus halophilus]
MDETTRFLAGRYVLLDQLGSGGAGAVWRAHDEVLDRTVAVKLLHRDLARDPATAARFRAEASAAAKLTHPNAVVIYDIGSVAGSDYLVMELVEGGTLDDVLDQGPLTPGVAAAVGAQVARALGTAHARGLVHRDVKPANVLVTAEGTAKVADFGIARALGEATSRLTTPGQVVGTARYLAPEQLRDQPIDARADVYAVGLLLHQAVTGRLPFGEGTAVEVASRRLVADGLPRPSATGVHLPAGLDEVIARATSMEPGTRYPDGTALATALGPLAAPDAAAELAARVARAAQEPLDRTAPSPRATAGRPPTAPPAPDTGGTAALPAWRGATWSPGDDPDVTDPRRRTSVPATAAVGASRTSRAGEPASGPRTAAHVAPAGSHADEPDTAAPAGRRRNWLPWLVTLLALLAVAWLLFADHLGTDGADAPDEEQQPLDSEGDAPTGELVTRPITATGDHDPFGGGSENPDLLDRAIDGDPDTAWTTVGYNSAALGNLKDGVGLWLGLDEPAALEQVTITTDHPGYDLTVYVGNGPPTPGTGPDEWGRAAGEVSSAGEVAEIPLQDAQGDTVLLWFTNLGPDGGRYRASVADVEVSGR